MSQEGLIRAIERASTDPGFRTQLKSNPANALAGYDLTDQERAALLSADPSQLRALGLDDRISKMKIYE